MSPFPKKQDPPTGVRTCSTAQGVQGTGSPHPALSEAPAEPSQGDLLSTSGSHWSFPNSTSTRPDSSGRPRKSGLSGFPGTTPTPQKHCCLDPLPPTPFSGEAGVCEGSSATPSPLQAPSHWLTIERSQQASPAGSVRRVFWTRSVHFKPRVYATEGGDGKGGASLAEQLLLRAGSPSRIPTSHPRGPDTHCLLAGRSRALRWVLAQPEAPCHKVGWRGPRPIGSGESGLERDEASEAWSPGRRHNYQRDGECGGLRGAARRPSPRLEGRGRLGSALSGLSPEAPSLAVTSQETPLLCPAVAGSQQPALPRRRWPGGELRSARQRPAVKSWGHRKGYPSLSFRNRNQTGYLRKSPPERETCPQFCSVPAGTLPAWRRARLPGPHSRPASSNRIRARPQAGGPSQASGKPASRRGSGTPRAESSVAAGGTGQPPVLSEASSFQLETRPRLELEPEDESRPC